MNILLTGASGFIGTGLLDRMTSVHALSLRTAHRRPDPELPPNVDAVRIDDIDAGTDWRRALAGIDVVVHAAARVHVMHETATDPLVAYRAVNTAGTLNLARQAAAAGVRRFVFLSTIKVNGDASPPGRPFTPGDPPAPPDAYGLSKHEAEAGLRAIADDTGLEVVVIRPPLVYGPGVGGNFLRLMQAVARGTPLPFGAVDNRRSLCALDNLVDLVVRCLGHSAAAGRVFMVSDDEDLSTPALIRHIARATGGRARLLPVPVGLLRAGATLVGRRVELERLIGTLQVDIADTRSRLGWSPPLSVEEGMRRAAAGLVYSG